VCVCVAERETGRERQAELRTYSDGAKLLKVILSIPNRCLIYGNGTQQFNVFTTINHSHIVEDSNDGGRSN